MSIVDVLLLGATSWSATWIIPALREHHLSYALTSRSGAPSKATGEPTIPFTLSDDFTREQVVGAVRALPPARALVIVFPIKNNDVVRAFVDAYQARFPHETQWIQLGSTRLWLRGHADSSSPIDPANARGQAEQVLLDLHDPAHGRQTAVLDLAGLYGGERHPINWVPKVAPTRDALALKGSLHLVHGLDVAYAVVLTLTAKKGEAVWGRRWIISDGSTHDWWQLILDFRRPENAGWVEALMEEHGIKSLPRPLATSDAQGPPRFIDRELDGSTFWDTVHAKPKVPKVDREPVGQLTSGL